MLDILRELLNLIANGTKEQDMYDKSIQLLDSLENEYNLTEDNIIIKQLVEKIDFLEELCDEADSINTISKQTQVADIIRNLNEIKEGLKGYAIKARVDTLKRTLVQKKAELPPGKTQEEKEFDYKAESIAPICNMCGIKMVYRENRQNGNSFWGCENFARPSNKCTITKYLTKDDKEYLGFDK
ncbi:hypothetical protein QIW49_08130 [Francisellaceae bacterium CB300]